MRVVRRLLKVGGILVGVLVVAIAGYLAYASATAARRLDFASAPFPDVKASSDPGAVERGRYLVYGPAHCSQCHSIADRNHPELVVPGVALSGGLEFAMGPIGTT